MSTMKKELLTTAMKRTSEWIFSQEIPSDVIVNAGGTSFSLHKFPLVSKCGYIRKLIASSNNANLSTIEIPDVPGGPEGFELAAKFCYGINFEITTQNIAMLRCASEYLEMTEEYSIGNLISRTEAYITEVSLTSLNGAVSILHASESLLPMAEKVKLVSRSIDSIAFVVCKDSGLNGSGSNSKPDVNWWAEDLTVLRIDMFQRVVIAMMSRGFKQCGLGPILVLYAQKSLRGLDTFGKGRKKIEPRQEHEKRIVLETIVSLLPREKKTITISFLSMLLRSSIYLQTTIACRLDLEKRMALQLEQAVLDDLLIPSYIFTGDTLFDVDTVERIMNIFLERENEGNHLPSDVERVTKLMENYLSEIASDRNLSVSKFIRLAEVMSEQSIRAIEDGMYRAIDIYLKAHPSLSDMERKRVCSVMDCQKLSREASAHAAQNDRLPIQTVVQVLYYEQQRLRQAMDGSTHTEPTDEVSNLRRENRDLKLELVKMKMRVKEMERSYADKSLISSSTGGSSPVWSAEKPPLPWKLSFMSSVKKLGRLIMADGLTPRNRAGKDWRHSVS